jgi:uncharacterized protein (DUF924 family)
MYERVINFWFKETKSEDWFKKNDTFDNKIRDRFGSLYEDAINKKLDEWHKSSVSCLALILILDQFSRNLFRDSALAFDQDPRALELSQLAINKNYLDCYSDDEKLFALLPLIHSENIKIHFLAKKLREKFLSGHPRYGTIEKSWDDHRLVIEKFGRYPHRCKLKGLELTEDEKLYLSQTDSSW